MSYITVSKLLQLGFTKPNPTFEPDVYSLPIQETEIENNYTYQYTCLVVDLELRQVSLQIYSDPRDGEEDIQDLFFKHIDDDLRLEVFVQVIKGSYEEY